MSAETALREFVDTNVLVYAFDSSAKSKQTAAAALLERLWEQGTGCVSVQVLQEFFVVVTRKIDSPLSIDEGADRVREFATWKVFAPTVADLLQGTLDLLILKTLALESKHGWGIAQRIQQISRDALQVGQGSLYPALHRLELNGLIASEWAASENNRRAKYYSITADGRKRLEVELADWKRTSEAIALVLQEG